MVSRMLSRRYDKNTRSFPGRAGTAARLLESMGGIALALVALPRYLSNSRYHPRIGAQLRELGRPQREWALRQGSVKPCTMAEIEIFAADLAEGKQVTGEQ